VSHIFFLVNYSSNVLTLNVAIFYTVISLIKYFYSSTNQEISLWKTSETFSFVKALISEGRERGCFLKPLMASHGGHAQFKSNVFLALFLSEIFA
jgi:hypothetical protein